MRFAPLLLTSVLACTPSPARQEPQPKAAASGQGVPAAASGQAIPAAPPQTGHRYGACFGHSEITLAWPVAAAPCPPPPDSPTARRSVTLGDLQLSVQYVSTNRRLDVPPEALLPARSPYKDIPGRRAEHGGHPSLDYDYEVDGLFVAGRMVSAGGLLIECEARWKAPSNKQAASRFLDSLAVAFSDGASAAANPQAAKPQAAKPRR